MQHSFCSFLLRLGHFLSAILSSVCCRTRPQWSFSCKIIFMSWNISKSIMRNNVRVLSASTCKRELAKHATSSVCVCVCLCACVSTSIDSPRRLRLSERAGMSGKINDVVLKTFLFSAMFLHCYFRMKHWAFLTSGQSHDLTSVRLAFKNIRHSFTMFSHRTRSALNCKPIYLCRQAITRGV